jgi:hypothetical protein
LKIALLFSAQAEALRLLRKRLPFMQALQDTLVVIAIVFGTAVTLFAVNSVLADISKLLY